MIDFLITPTLGEVSYNSSRLSFLNESSVKTLASAIGVSSKVKIFVWGGVPNSLALSKFSLAHLPLL